MDASCDYLDYTWNWTMLMSFDCLATTSVFPSPRINLNIDASAAEVKHGFVLNRYLNIQPRKPDGANGTDYIRNHQELSAALKQCAKLRAVSALLPGRDPGGRLHPESALPPDRPGHLSSSAKRPARRAQHRPAPHGRVSIQPCALVGLWLREIPGDGFQRQRRPRWAPSSSPAPPGGW